jgi:hypothetical protein
MNSSDKRGERSSFAAGQQFAPCAAKEKSVAATAIVPTHVDEIYSNGAVNHAGSNGVDFCYLIAGRAV